MVTSHPRKDGLILWERSSYDQGPHAQASGDAGLRPEPKPSHPAQHPQAGAEPRADPAPRRSRAPDDTHLRRPGIDRGGDAIRDVLDPRKMKAKHLNPSKDGGVDTIDGCAVADPGFISALQKISKSYERPE